jgi:hypothetical protein
MIDYIFMNKMVQRTWDLQPILTQHASLKNLRSAGACNVVNLLTLVIAFVTRVSRSRSINSKLIAYVSSAGTLEFFSGMIVALKLLIDTACSSNRFVHKNIPYHLAISVFFISQLNCT